MNCSAADGAPGGLLLLLLLLLGRKGNAHRTAAVAVLVVAGAAHAESPITSDFSVRITAAMLRGLTASRVGAEVGANVSLSRRFDLALSLSLGNALGGRLGVTWHLKDDGEWVRPFVQVRGILHPVHEGLAGGAGTWAGLFVPVGPGRIQAGALLEVYLGPKGYVPWDAFVTIGYELDIYRRIERAGIQPEPDFGGTEVPPLKGPESSQPAESEGERLTAVEPGPLLDLPSDERTRVVTRVSLTKEFVFFDERRSSWLPKSEAAVRKVAEVLKRYPQLQRIEVAGHADDGDSDSECMTLSLKRAERVMNELVQAGIEPTRLTAQGYGKLKNRVPTRGPARKREPNRRVDFTVMEESW